MVVDENGTFPILAAKWNFLDCWVEVCKEKKKTCMAERGNAASNIYARK